MRTRIALPIACLFAVTAASCSREAPIERTPVPVKVQKVATLPALSGIRYSANIQPNERVDLAFKVSGYVSDILQVHGADGRTRDVQEGDWVDAGTVLAKVSEDDYRHRVGQASASAVQAEATLTRAKADFERASALYDTKSLTRSDFDAAKSQYDGASAQVDGARAKLREAESSLRDCSLRAPMKSLLLGRNVEVGSLASPGGQAFSLADTRSVKAVFGVPDVTVQQLKMGQAFTITTEANRGVDFASRITRIAPFADSKSRVFEVEVTLPNADQRLKVGMIASLEVGEGLPGGAVPVVPLTSIVRPRGRTEGYGVFVVEGEGDRAVARSRDVKLGEAFGSMIAVTEGLQVGDPVIVTGATLVLDGASVRVIP
jgi:multidrug efflux system membrane fusion protein